MQTSRRHWLTRLTTTGLALWAGLHSAAWALEVPQGKVILTVSGKIAETNRDGKAVFDLAMLQKLPQHTFTTQTPWDAKPVKFSGPLLKDVLAAVKASGNQLSASALNDYKITLPVDDASQYGVMLAHQMNDVALSVRTKGPLFVIYPFDSRPELKSSKYYERSIWQLKSIDVQ